MLVTKRNFESAIARLAPVRELAFDTETTTLHWWNSPWHPIRPRVFSIQFTGEDAGGFFSYYFDFKCEKSGADFLTPDYFERLQNTIFGDPFHFWFAHNAKFDLHHLANHAIELAGDVHCSSAMQRIVNNLEPKFGLSLDELSFKYFGEKKLDVKSYMKEHGLIQKVPKSPLRKDTFDEQFQFDRLPLEMLVEYGARDTLLCYKLAKMQQKKIAELDAEIFDSDTLEIGGEKRGLNFLYRQELKLTKALFKMERNGQKIDRAFCASAFEAEVARYTICKVTLDELAIEALGPEAQIDWLSPKQLKPLFEKLDIPYSFTEKGNASFDAAALEKSDSDVAKNILKYRYHYKRAHTYFENLLRLADTNDLIHPDFKQGVPETGRMSCWEPNLQNIPKRADKDEADFPVRACFVPRSPDFLLGSYDYDQVEYRLMLDYAGEESVIKAILEEGLDVHAAIGQEVGMDRQDAKTFNFMVLYGAGVRKIAEALGKEEWEAKNLKAKYFARLPNVDSLIRKIKDTARARGYVFNFYGRVLQYAPEDCYKAPNGLIQGTAADVMKRAIVDVSKLMEGKKSTMNLTVHDELVFDIHKEETFLAEQIASAMKNAYPHRLIPLTAGAAHSKTSWNTVEDTLPL